MRKMRFLILLIILAALNGCYKLIPKRYFNKYSKVLSEPIDASKLDISKVYMLEDAFLSDYYSKKYNREVHSYTYTFFFRNHLTARLSIPLIKKNGELILSQEDYFRRVREKNIDDTEDYYWTYYDVKDGVITEYDLEYDVGNWNVLDIGKIVKREYVLVNDGFILNDFLKRFKNDTNELKKHTPKKTNYSFKPDSTKSDIYCRLTYKQKGYRRIYAGNSPDYINPCQIQK